MGEVRNDTCFSPEVQGVAYGAFFTAALGFVSLAGLALYSYATRDKNAPSASGTMIKDKEKEKNDKRQIYFSELSLLATA